MAHKKGNINPETYRLIALVNCDAKFFTSILNNRLNNWVEEFKLIPEFQLKLGENTNCTNIVLNINIVIHIHPFKKNNFL